ncbi:hypothetical protein DSBG_1298 [Desulfosporosinus sp. BG]|nr:hypothetical protein DSBG_1298 [Desulfosporosinus sp. BG]
MALFFFLDYFHDIGRKLRQDVEFIFAEKMLGFEMVNVQQTVFCR